MPTFHNNPNFRGVPDDHTNVKVSSRTMASLLSILAGVTSIEENEATTYKKLQIYSKLLNEADDEQADRILRTHSQQLSDLLIGTLGEFHEETFRALMLNGMEQALDAVESGQIKEVQYKQFCDQSKAMLDLLQAIDRYNADHYKSIDEWDVACSTNFTKYNDTNILDIYLYRPY